MEQKYLVSLVDGIQFFTTDINLNTLQGLMGQNNVFAIEIGGKTFSKQLIGYVAKASSIESANQNIVFKLGRELLYANVTDVKTAMTNLTDSLNKNGYVLFGDVLFSRGLFQYAEPYSEEIGTPQ